jgi:DNA-binding MarR family transcriptional regulator
MATSTETTVEESYLILIGFLMMAKRRVMEIGTDYGLTGMQTMMVFLLDQPKPMNSFTKVFNCDASNVTGLVDGLEQKDIAKRFESTQDRRIKMVELGDKGRDIRTALLRDLSSQDSRLQSRLHDDDFNPVMRLRCSTPRASVSPEKRLRRRRWPCHCGQ